MKRFAKGSPNAHRFFHARLPAVPDDGPLYPWFAHFKDNHYFLNHQIFLVNKHEKRPPISEQPPTLKTKELMLYLQVYYQQLVCLKKVKC